MEERIRAGLLKAKTTKQQYFLKQFMQNMEYVSWNEETKTAKFKFFIHPRFCLYDKWFGGGAIATLIDLVTAWVIVAAAGAKPLVTIGIGVDFISKAKAGQILDIEAKCDKVGSLVGTSHCTFKIKDKLIARGKQNAYLMDEIPKL
jgi:acyl-coenzyme A thioesterase PaaI-like protein